jgi:hypothetical protein
MEPVAEPDRPTVKEPIPDWWFIGVLVVIFGAPMMLLFGAAFLRNPPVILVLGGLFAWSTWWYFQRREATAPLRPSGPSTTASPSSEGPTASPGLETTGWMPWSASGVRGGRPVPLHVESPLTMDACLGALAQLLPPIDPDLRFTRNIGRRRSDRWMDIEDFEDFARLSLHIDHKGYALPQVPASAGIDGLIHKTMSGSSLDLWARPSRLTGLFVVVIGLGYLCLGLLSVRAALDGAIDADLGRALFGLAFAACVIGLGVGSVRNHRKLTTRLIDELVLVVEDACDAPVLAPPLDAELPPAPEHVLTPVEREVHAAASQVRIARPGRGAGWKPTAAVLISGLLLVVGSVGVLGS